MFSQKISKFPFSCNLRLYLPVEHCKYFPLPKIPFLEQASPLQFPKGKLQGRIILLIKVNVKMITLKQKIKAKHF